MAASNSQRVAAFLLASVFLVTTIGTTAFVIYQINQDGDGATHQTNPQNQQSENPVQNTKPSCRNNNQ